MRVTVIHYDCISDCLVVNDMFLTYYWVAP